MNGVSINRIIAGPHLIKRSGHAITVEPLRFIPVAPSIWDYKPVEAKPNNSKTLAGQLR